MPVIKASEKKTDFVIVLSFIVLSYSQKIIFADSSVLIGALKVFFLGGGAEISNLIIHKTISCGNVSKLDRYYKLYAQ